MTGPPAEQRDAGRERTFRNRVAVLVIGGIVASLAALYLVLLPGAPGVVGGVCGFAVLALVFVAWEYLMKPGYGLLHRAPSGDPEETEPTVAGEPPRARKVPRSPRPP